MAKKKEALTLKMVKMEPPPRTYGGGREGVASLAQAQLEAKPGEWHLVRSFEGHSGASALTSGLKARGLEAVSRKAEDGGVNVFARAVGAKKAWADGTPRKKAAKRKKKAAAPEVVA